MPDFPGQGTLGYRTFNILDPSTFVLARIFGQYASIQGLSEGVDLWPKLSNPELSGEKHT